MQKLALIGVGHIHTPGFIKRINERSDVQVKRVWDHETERAHQRAEELAAQVITDLGAIWSDPEIEGVVICSETDRHEELVLAAANAHKHMFVEKPLGLKAADGYKMADAIEKAGVLFQTGYFMRGQPIHIFLKEHIEKGSFGKITRVRHSNCHGGSLGGWFDTEWRWMADIEQAGVGGFGDLGTHSLDILMWLLGGVERVTAVIDGATGRYGDVDEYGEGLMVFKNGIAGTLAAGWVDVANPVRILISGTEGHAHVVNNQLYIKSEHIEGANGESAWTDLPEAQPHAFELFLDALVGKTDVTLVSPREAADRSAVMEAFYEANAGQKWVHPTTK